MLLICTCVQDWPLRIPWRRNWIRSFLVTIDPLQLSTEGGSLWHFPQPRWRSTHDATMPVLFRRPQVTISLSFHGRLPLVTARGLSSSRPILFQCHSQASSSGCYNVSVSSSSVFPESLVCCLHCKCIIWGWAPLGHLVSMSRPLVDLCNRLHVLHKRTFGVRGESYTYLASLVTSGYRMPSFLTFQHLTCLENIGLIKTLKLPFHNKCIFCVFVHLVKHRALQPRFKTAWRLC